MARKMATTVYLTESQWDALADLSKRTGVPQAVMIREGVDLALEKWKRETGRRAARAAS